MTNLQETLELQERIIKKQQREIKKLERTIALLQEEILNYKKEFKMKLLEIQKKIKGQSFTIKDLKRQTKLETRQIEEMSLKQLEKEEISFSKSQKFEEKIEILKIENEELINNINQKNVLILEKENDISNLKTKLKELEDQIKYIKSVELDDLRYKLQTKEDLLTQQNEAVNKLTLEIKKYEVEIAELEYKLSDKQTKQGEFIESQKKIEKQEELIIHLRKKNISNEEKIEELRKQLNNANIRINDLLEKIKSLQDEEDQSELDIPYFQIDFPE